jgi:hypothetical protein
VDDRIFARGDERQCPLPFSLSGCFRLAKPLACVAGNYGSTASVPDVSIATTPPSPLGIVFPVMGRKRSRELNV